jgi:hypothetical protein
MYQNVCFALNDNGKIRSTYLGVNNKNLKKLFLNIECFIRAKYKTWLAST